MRHAPIADTIKAKKLWTLQKNQKRNQRESLRRRRRKRNPKGLDRNIEIGIFLL
jgi:hypothetical protein